jgi:hypothetical protein
VQGAVGKRRADPDDEHAPCSRAGLVLALFAVLPDSGPKVLGVHEAMMLGKLGL